MQGDDKEEEAINPFNHSFHKYLNHSFHKYPSPPLYKLGILLSKTVNTPCACADHILVKEKMTKRTNKYVVS